MDFIRKIPIVIIIPFLSACVTKKIIQFSDNDNNLFSATTSNTISSSESFRVIFEGTSNIFEIITNNAIYFDKDRDVVIVITGDHNIIRLYNTNIISSALTNSDTIIFVGNNMKYVMDLSNQIILSKKNYKVDTLKVEQTEIKRYDLLKDIIFDNDTSLIHLDFFDSLVTASYAFRYFSERVNNDAESCYQLGELYLFGIGTKRSPDKAIDLYEYASLKNHIPSLRRLGDICSGAFDHPIDKKTATFYYHMGAQLGDEYCHDKLIK